MDQPVSLWEASVSPMTIQRMKVDGVHNYNTNLWDVGKKNPQAFTAKIPF